MVSIYTGSLGFEARLGKRVRMIEKRQIPCNLCGSESFALLYPVELGAAAATVDYQFSRQTRKTYQIVKCDKCGLIFTNPMPALQASYEENGVSLSRYRVGRLINPRFNLPGVRNAMVPLKLSGEMLMLATKRGRPRSEVAADQVANEALA